MDKQIERAGDDNKNNIGMLYGIGLTKKRISIANTGWMESYLQRRE